MFFDRIAIEKKAQEIRKSQGIDGFGVPDIFSLIQALGYYWVRYPFGQKTLCGCAYLYQGERVIVTNSFEILAREFFTAAHELGHAIYDLSYGGTSLLVDATLNDEETRNELEQRANQFAAELLLPRLKVDQFLRQVLQKKGKDLNAYDIVRIQVEFKVSYEAALNRLHSLLHISEEQREKLKIVRDMSSSRELFRAMGADDSLLDPWNQISVSPHFLQWVNDNYQAGLIPYESLKRAYTLIGAEGSLPSNEC